MLSAAPIRLWFADFWHAESAAAIRALNPLYHFLVARFNIALDPRNPDFLLYSCYVGKMARFRFFPCPRIYYTAENLPPDPAECDWALSFKPDSDHNFRLPWWFLAKGQTALHAPRTAASAAAAWQGKTQFCNFIYSNPKCQQRNDFFRALHAQKPVHAAGALFNNTPGIAARLSDNYEDSKLQFLRPYQFTIAYENESAPGYITEKLSQALAANTIPIYWGAPDVAQDFNPAAFIHARDFANNDDLVQHVLTVAQTPALAHAYLSAQPLAPAATQLETRLSNHFARLFSTPPIAPKSRTLYNQILRHTPRKLAKEYLKHRRQTLKHRTNPYGRSEYISPNK